MTLIYLLVAVRMAHSSGIFSMAGARAVITGSTKGIGLATAKEFLLLGASVVLVSRSAADVDALVKELTAAGHGGHVFGCAADVSSAEGRATLVGVQRTCSSLTSLLPPHLGMNG